MGTSGYRLVTANRSTNKTKTKSAVLPTSLMSFWLIVHLKTKFSKFCDFFHFSPKFKLYLGRVSKCICVFEQIVFVYLYMRCSIPHPYTPPIHLIQSVPAYSSMVSSYLRKILPKYCHIIQCCPSWNWPTPHADFQQSLSCHIPDCCKIKNPGIATIVLISIFFTIISIPVPTVRCGVFAKLLSQIFIVFTTISKLIQSYF